MINHILAQKILHQFPDLSIKLQSKFVTAKELNIKILGTARLLEILTYLKKEEEFYCQQLIDLTAVDYLHYGISEWNTTTATMSGFNRAVINLDNYLQHSENNNPYRFGLVYQLLSLTNNLRITIQFLLSDDNITVPSCVDLWPVANWYEREVFDLFGIIFTNHPKLTRIFNEENFNGHPFRKDFPLSGYVETRFDAKQQQVVYEPIDLTVTPIFPKVVRYKDLEEII